MSEQQQTPNTTTTTHTHTQGTGSDWFEELVHKGISKAATVRLHISEPQGDLELPCAPYLYRHKVKNMTLLLLCFLQSYLQSIAGLCLL